MTTGEVSKLTGVPRGTITAWVRDGLLRPAGGTFGTGDPLYFNDADARRVLAIAAIRRAYGDGALAREVIARAMPRVTADTTVVDVDAFRLALV